MSVEVSVVVCTHNPRIDYIERVLAGLRGQTLPYSRWEMLVVDNASKEPVAERCDLSWHPKGRHIVEPTLGLTAARLRGIAEASSELIVFVDDDNVLAPDYLEQAVRVADRYPFLGVWGGSAIAEFETEPESWARPYLPFLALRECVRDDWANLLSHNESRPNGAGMCLRRSVAEGYAFRVRNDARHVLLDRRGVDLLACGDSAIDYAACEMGLGTGSIKALRLTHLIPSVRLTKEYFLRLMERFECSYVLFAHLFGLPYQVDLSEPPKSRRPIDRVRQFMRRFRSIPEVTFETQVALARKKGAREGLRIVDDWRARQV
jgi:glycosyltransferase involved in cell wall biosynthesis